MKKLFSIVCAMLLVVGLTAGQASAISFCKDCLEDGNAGGPAGPKTFDDTCELAEGAQLCIDIWVNDIPNPTLLTSGYWIVYDPACLQLDSFEVYDGANGPAGPWDPGGTTIVPDPAGPGTYFGAAVQFSTVPIDAGGDIIIGKICVTCLNGQTDCSITVQTIPGFDTVVGDSTVFDQDIIPNTLLIDQIPPPPCECTGLDCAPSEGRLNCEIKSSDGAQTAQFTPQVTGTCAPNNFIYSDDCTEGSVDPSSGLFTALIVAGETCTVTAVDLANTGVTCSTELTLTPVTCDGEIARGRECPGETIDDPAYNRPGRRGLAATCDDIIDFTVCSDCDPFDPACLEWTIDPPAPWLSIAQIDDCCWRLTIEDSCDQITKVMEYEITVTDTCNNWSDTIDLTIGKVILDVGDTAVDPQSGSANVELSLTNPAHHVRALTADIASCDPQIPDNLVCTACTANPDRALQFTCSAAEQADGSCKVVMYSTNPAALITQGAGPIATVLYDAIDPKAGDCVDLCAINIEISDQFNEDLCACDDPGQVCFKTCGDIYPQDCIGGPCADTVCGDGVVDLFDILEAVDIILGLQEATLCQIGNGDVPNGMPPYCGNPPGDPNCDTDGEITIFDVLVLIDKALGKANCCDYCLFDEIF